MVAMQRNIRSLDEVFDFTIALLSRKHRMKSMMRRNIFAALVAIATIISIVGCVHSGTDPAKIKDQENARKEVFKYFKILRSGESTNVIYPGFTWKHIPVLLELAESTRILWKFPGNFASSFYQLDCQEGMLALWFIEGIRKAEGYPYPSLNPICLSRNMKEDANWQDTSAKNHAAVLLLYKKWWTEVASQSTEKGRSTDPLEGTNLYWY